MAKNTSVMAIYTDRTAASEAINVLHKERFRPADISVLWPDNPGSKDFAHERRTKTLEGAAIGAASGAVAGAVLAWVLSMQTATNAVSGALAAAGPLLAALAGAGAGAALGWIIGLVVGSRRSEYVAKRFAGRIRRGGILVSVHCDSQEWCDRAKRALRDTGARQISTASEAPADFGTTDRPTERAPLPTIERNEVPAKPPADYSPDYKR